MFTISSEFQFFADNLPQIVWTSNTDGNLDYFNTFWYKFTGLSYEESKDLGIQQILHEEDREDTIQLWKNSFMLGENFEKEYRLKSSEGKYHWFLARAIPMKDDKGNIVKWFGTCTDIQKSKEQSQKLEELNKELVVINGDIDNFIYTASHELKAPVSNLQGLIEAINDVVVNHKKDEDCDVMVDMMNQSVGQLNRTINDLINITKVQRELNGHKHKVNLNEALGEAIEALKAHIQASGTILRTDFREPFVYLNRENMKSIFYNMLSNSVKFRSMDRVNMVELYSYRENGYTLVGIRDNGLGINPRKKNKLFSMFRRLHPEVEGSGVGLYTVKRMVENAHGKIDLVSEEGKGSDFKIYFKNQ
ncbi:MAG: sensor histidine kinase [Cytophagaceae bacterium]